MKILLYGRFSSHHFAIRNVILNICEGLNQDTDNNYTVVINKENTEFFSRFTNLDKKIISINRDNAILNHLYTIFILPFFVLKNKYDLLVIPQITFYFFSTSKLIVYIHDLIEYRVNNQGAFSLKLRKFFYKRLARITDRIITVSENSRTDIIDILKVNPEKVVVNYDGCDKNLKPYNKNSSINEITTKYEVCRNKYILYVGYLAHPQKNLVFVINGLKDILVENNLNFVLIGPEGKDAQIIHEKIQKTNDAIDKPRIFAIGTVDKDLLPYFYSSAECFVFPSLYEGFGMPVVEAMACGCPVVTSNTSSLQEIAQGYARLINPNDLDEFKSSLKEVLLQPRKDLSFYRDHLKKFTWNKHVDNLIHLINNFGGLDDKERE